MNIIVRDPETGDKVVRAATPDEMAALGYTSSNGEWVAPVTYQDLAPWQFYAMLDIAGVKQQVLDAVAAMTGTDGIIARSKLERANVFMRADPVIDSVASAIGMTDEQINTLWLQAQSL